MVKLHSTIEELEQQAEKIKSIQQVFTELEQLQQQVTMNLEEQQQLFHHFQRTDDQIQQTTQTMGEQFSNYQQSANQLLEQYASLKGELLKQLQAISMENGQLYRDTKEYFRDQLELSESKIQSSLRDLRRHMEEEIERLKHGLEGLRKKIEEEGEKQRRLQVTLSLIVSGVSLLGVAVLLLAHYQVL